MPAWRAPYGLALAAGYFDELRCAITSGVPTVPLEGVRIARDRRYANSSKAVRDLGYSASPVRAALERAVAWYRENATS
jgi:dihydroflavonol-4-reductase